MDPVVRKRLAWIALGAAVLLGGAYAVFRTPLRVWWIALRGAPPASTEAREAAAADLRALGPEVRGSLLGLLRAPGGSRAKKSWIAEVLLREPFFARKQVEDCLASPDPATARGAAFALMEGVEDEEDVRPVVVTPGLPRPRPVRREPTWDPTPAIPVLVDWLRDRADLDARHAAALLGRVPRGDARVPEALLAAVEELPSLVGPGAGDLQLRKFAVMSALQSLHLHAKDPQVVSRVCKVVAWLEKSGLADAGWDVEREALTLIERSGGNGVDFDLLQALARSRSNIVRQRLAGVLGDVQGPGVVEAIRELLRDESEVVRRAALTSMKDRRDRRLFDLVPYLLEDSYVFIRSDALRHVGDLCPVDPERARTLVPLLVAALEEPWPGGRPGDRNPMLRGGRAEVIANAAFSLHLLTRRHPGFEESEFGTDWKGMQKKCESLASDPAARAKIVEEWRTTVPPVPPEARVAPLVQHLEDRSPANIVRAMKELKRITGASEGFPPEVLEDVPDETGARNAVRAWMKTPGCAETIEKWKRRAGK